MNLNVLQKVVHVHIHMARSLSYLRWRSTFFFLTGTHLCVVWYQLLLYARLLWMDHCGSSTTLHRYPQD